MELRAQCKALRSLHRKVKSLGRTPDGHRLFEADSVKLALPKGARHFHRVLSCSRCGTEMVEWDRAVTRRHDLGAGRRERLCEACSAVPPEGAMAEADPVTSPALDLPEPESDPEVDVTVAEPKRSQMG
jgi:hypothetical protein